MPTTKHFTLGTWNMQKGPALALLKKSSYFAAAARSARHQILSYLMGHCNLVFVQEPPVDIREQTQLIDYDNFESQVEAWISYNENADNQVHQNANRPALYSTLMTNPVQVPGDCPCNGAEDAYRLPAMSWAWTEVGLGIFISLHATSGANAKKNTDAFLVWLDGWVHTTYPNASFVIIGADFNHTPWPTARALAHSRVEFELPTQMTQQSGSVLDGFCCLSFDPALTIKWNNAVRVCTGEHNGPILTSMVQANANLGQGVNGRGYLAALQPGPLPGTTRTLQGHTPLTMRMSDHCAVVGSLQLTCP